MKPAGGNLLARAETPAPDGREIFETLLTGPGELLVERIVSHGQTTAPGQWYDQDRDEWVMVLEGRARLSLAGGREATLEAGDWLWLPKHCRHRVEYASSPCVWLAVHGRDLELNGRLPGSAEKPPAPPGTD